MIIVPTHKMINETELFMKYKSSYISAFFDYSINLFLLITGHYILYCLKNNIWVYLLLPIMSLLNIKTFMSLHDCGHGSYTPNKTLNYIIGTFSGIITCTSSLNWCLDHHTHHLTNGSINNSYNYAFNETIRFKLSDYKSANPIKKTLYKIMSQPFVKFCVEPLLYYGLIQRFIYITKKLKYKHKINETLLVILFNHMINNCGIILLLNIIHKIGTIHLFIIYIYISHIIGFLLFFNQHTFKPAYIVDWKEFNQRDSGLKGSSFILIPKYLKYFFSGIEYHHIHHMNTKIPGYNLQKYHEEVVSKSNIFDNIVKLSMTDCYNNLWLVFYDEDKKRYITFAEADKKDKCM
jgi:acyl-lipid omega-6 desaturase (Delta-12 desaturase)